MKPLFSLIIVRLSLIAVYCLFLSALTSNAAIYGGDSSSASRSILVRPRQFTPAQIISGDTLAIDTSSKIEIISAPGMNGYAFTHEQDSAYAQLMRLGIPAGTLAQIHAKMYARAWENEQRNAEKQPWQVAAKMFDLPAEYFLPSGQERTMHAYGIAQSQYVPNLSPYKSPNAGIQIPLSSIAAFFGFEEDVSPVMQYSIDYVTPVQIVVYSMQAKIIATIFDGRQMPGKYRITWNGRDDLGRRMPPGDYVSEVRIGKERYVRKRIVLQ